MTKKMDEALKAVREAAAEEAILSTLAWENFTFMGLDADDLRALIEFYEASTGKHAYMILAKEKLARLHQGTVEITQQPIPKRFEDDPGTR